jgi:hypothetical protein
MAGFGRLPAQLACISVFVDNRPAGLSYASEIQANGLPVPADEIGFWLKFGATSAVIDKSLIVDG